MYLDTFHCLMFFSFSKNQNNWKDPAGKRTGKNAAGEGLGGQRGALSGLAVVGFGRGRARAWRGLISPMFHSAWSPSSLLLRLLATQANHRGILSVVERPAFPCALLLFFTSPSLPASTSHPCPSLQLCKRLSRRSTGVA